jgi:hypothetical protein
MTGGMYHSFHSVGAKPKLLYLAFAAQYQITAQVEHSKEFSA